MITLKLTWNLCEPYNREQRRLRGLIFEITFFKTCNRHLEEFGLPTSSNTYFYRSETTVMNKHLSEVTNTLGLCYSSDVDKYKDSISANTFCPFLHWGMVVIEWSFSVRKKGTFFLSIIVNFSLCLVLFLAYVWSPVKCHFLPFVAFYFWGCNFGSSPSFILFFHRCLTQRTKDADSQELCASVLKLWRVICSGNGIYTFLRNGLNTNFQLRHVMTAQLVTVFLFCEAITCVWWTQVKCSTVHTSFFDFCNDACSEFILHLKTGIVVMFEQTIKHI